MPPGSTAPTFATGTRSPSCTFGAPVTICSGSASPTSMEQMTMWSEFSCLRTERILPTTTFCTASFWSSRPSTPVP